jgi:ABC-type multidrug transport system ATPase subunit
MISVTGLQKRFGAIRAVDGLEFECAPGEMIALIGPNGSGKSTVLRIIAGLMKADRGEVRISDELMTVAAVQLRKKISYLPQRVAFPEQATAKELLTFFARVRKIPEARVTELISAFALHDFERKKVNELSGGMLQRLAIAVTFLPEADLYILDEATNNLDAEGLTRFRAETLSVLKRGAAVIMSTHILKEAENLAHKIAVIARGRVVLTRRIEQFVEDVGQSRKMWITLHNLSEKYGKIALDMGAEKVSLNCETMTVECKADLRVPILHALFQAGATIKEFGLQEPSLEKIYYQCLSMETTEQ